MPPKRRNDKLPPYVYKRKSRYELRVYIGKGQPMQAIYLCHPDAPLSEVWKAYELLNKDEVKTLSWLLNKYLDSESFKSKANSTQKMQTDQVMRISKYKMRNGKNFGGVEIKQITSGAIRKYLDARERDNAAVSGNRERALISVAWNWALERDLVKEINPCSVVKRNKETPRTRYATEREYNLTYKLAERYPYLQPCMEMAYLCRMRRGEILNAKRSQILIEGFDTLRTKGSRDTITAWSDRLRAAVNYDHGEVASMYIIHDKKGQQITVEAFKSAWTRLKKLMKEAGIEPFNFHDIKAAGVSDVEGSDDEKMSASGHKDRKTMQIYDRKKRIVNPTK